LREGRLILTSVLTWAILTGAAVDMKAEELINRGVLINKSKQYQEFALKLGVFAVRLTFIKIL
jgi:hypothetical protein